MTLVTNISFYKALVCICLCSRTLGVCCGWICTWASLQIAWETVRLGKRTGFFFSFMQGHSCMQLCLTGSLHQVLRIVCSILLERNVNKGSADTIGALSRLVTPYSTNIQVEKTAFMFKEVGEI